MNWKKHLKLKTDAEVPYSERDRQFYERLLTDVESGEIQSKSGQQTAVKAKTFNLQKTLLLLGAFLVAVGIVCGLVFGLSAQKIPLYKIENITSKEVAFDEMIEDLNYFDLSLIESEASNLYYDTKSDDKLYYTLTTDKLYYNFTSIVDASNLSLFVVINKYFKYDFNFNGVIKSAKLEDYTVKYSYGESQIKDTVEYKGLIKIKTESVYFIYNQSPADGEQAFLNSIEQLIKIKE